MPVRSWLRDGRFDAAFAFYQHPDDGSFDAEDLFTLGSALLERGRVCVGWTALEAARPVEPKHAPSNQALDGLRGKLALARGHEQMALRDVADRVEFLGAVRGGPPLDSRHERRPTADEFAPQRSGVGARYPPCGGIGILAGAAHETGDRVQT